MLVYYVVAVLSILLYLHGFFPIPVRPSDKWLLNNVTSEPPYNRAVIIIIDALRLDFISDDNTPFLSSAYRNTGCFIQLKVETPTVTLPRIKALTTGNVPQFIDVILNLANPTKVEDSFIHRAHANGKKIVFFGDDIWVKLFPEEFLRNEGTSSFFVNDFKEVDDNVTRNVKIEKNRGDWDIMILHYLGLDHIGHVYGPKSSLIPIKLEEMDSIIKDIYESTENTIIIITGDHGMRDSGGHGGSTHSETNVPLIVLGMPCINDSFAQIDIPSNLAILLGFDIPSTSIGQLQASLLKKLSNTQYLQALKYNTDLLRRKLDICEDIETAHYFLDLYLLNKDEKFMIKSEEIYKNCAKRISEKLQKTSVQQNLFSLMIASVSCLIVLVKIFQYIGNSLEKSRLEQDFLILLIVLQFFNINQYLNLLSIVGILVLCLKKLKIADMTQLNDSTLLFLVLITIIHPITFFSSSFLEEEHQFWYFFANTFISINILNSKNQTVEWFLLFIAVRFIRTINQVGDKWASSPDLADWLLQNENYLFLQLMFILALCLTFFGIKTNSKLVTALDILILMSIFIFRSVANEAIVIGRFLWFLIFFKLLLLLKCTKFLHIWVVVITLLLKPYNVILIPVCFFASQLFHKTLKKSTLIIAHWWLGNLMFFAQGHDNSLASVDISSGYIGLSNYKPIYVFPQVLCHTYALPVLSHLLLFSSKSVDIRKSFAIFVLFRLYVVLLVFINTFIQRYHLFIWSVFAPKMFVEASHFGFLFIEVVCFYISDVIKHLLE